MDLVAVFAPLVIIILICFLAGILLRVHFLNKVTLQLRNTWWVSYTKKVMTIWLKFFVFCVLAGILLLWLDGFIKIPKTNLLFKAIQFLSSLVFGFAVTIIQCDFIGLGFLLIPFRDKSPMNEEIQKQMNKRISQIAVWIMCIVLLLSILLDWVHQLVF